MCPGQVVGGAVEVRHGSAKVGKIVFHVIRRGSCSWLPECAEWVWGFVTSRGGQGAGVWWVPWWVLGGVACGGMLGGGAGQSVGGGIVPEWSRRSRLWG